MKQTFYITCLLAFAITTNIYAAGPAVPLHEGDNKGRGSQSLQTGESGDSPSNRIPCTDGVETSQAVIEFVRKKVSRKDSGCTLKTTVEYQSWDCDGDEYRFYFRRDSAGFTTLVQDCEK